MSQQDLDDMSGSIFALVNGIDSQFDKRNASWLDRDASMVEPKTYKLGNRIGISLFMNFDSDLLKSLANSD